MNRNSLLLTVMVVLGSTAASAQTATTTMNVSATVVKVCNVSTTSLAFGSYLATSASANTASATISVTCTNGTGYEVALDAGSGSGATTSTRRMTNSGDTLAYQLFRDASYSLNWGATSGGDVLSSSGSGALVTHTVYGRIATGQFRTAGSYSDTVTITVTY